MWKISTRSLKMAAIVQNKYLIWMKLDFFGKRCQGDPISIRKPKSYAEFQGSQGQINFVGRKSRWIQVEAIPQLSFGKSTDTKKC